MERDLECGDDASRLTFAHGYQRREDSEAAAAAPGGGAGRARPAQGRNGGVGALQQGDALPLLTVRDPYYGPDAPVRRPAADPALALWPDGRRCAARRAHRGGTDRRRHVLLGPAHAPAPRRRREGAAPPRRAPR